MQSRLFLATTAIVGSIFLPGIAAAAVSASSGTDFATGLFVHAAPSSAIVGRGDALPEVILALTEEEKKKLAKKKAAEEAAAKKKADEAAAKKKAEEAAAKKKREEEQQTAEQDEDDDDEEHTSPTYTGQGQTCPRWDHSCRR